MGKKGKCTQGLGRGHISAKQKEDGIDNPQRKNILIVENIGEQRIQKNGR